MSYHSMGDAQRMTATTMKIERSDPAIRAVLDEYSPEECASETFDLGPAEAVLNRWWEIAVIRANPLSEAEQVQIARAKVGDFSGLLTRDEHGDWSGCRCRVTVRYGWRSRADFVEVEIDSSMDTFTSRVRVRAVFRVAVREQSARCVTVWQRRAAAATTPQAGRNPSDGSPRAETLGPQFGSDHLGRRSPREPSSITRMPFSTGRATG
jgi:hypothetical protein